MIEAPGAGVIPSATRTGTVPAGLRIQKFLPTFPYPLADQPHWQAVFAEREAHKARMRAHRMMKQR